MPSPPKTIGDYKIERELGAGAAGTVYAAATPEGRPVAIKLLHCSEADMYHVQRRFVREGSVLQKLSHPNITEFIDFGLHEGELFMVAELVDSGTLAELLTGRLPWRETAEVGVQLCSALAYVHEHGIVHRDIKPGNIFLSSAGEVKLGDFGLARDPGSEKLTVEGETVGTALYMSPEQISGEEITPLSDLYAVGCVLYQMLSGATPFEGDHLFQLIEQHLNRRPANLHQLVPECPQGMAALVMQMLAKDPAQRPASAAEVQHRLEDILAGGRGAAPQRAAAEAPQKETADAGASATPSAALATPSGAASNAVDANLTQRLQEAARSPLDRVSWVGVAALVGVIVLVIIAAQFFASS